MTDDSPRAKARKDLRDYDNPKSGRNSNYHSPVYLKQVLLKWNMGLDELRAWANERKHTKQHKWS